MEPFRPPFFRFMMKSFDLAFLLLSVPLPLFLGCSLVPFLQPIIVREYFHLL
jgi:hypothetical protein